jgi:hypothetical protein
MRKSGARREVQQRLTALDQNPRLQKINLGRAVYGEILILTRGRLLQGEILILV